MRRSCFAVSEKILCFFYLFFLYTRGRTASSASAPKPALQLLVPLPALLFIPPDTLALLMQSLAIVPSFLPAMPPTSVDTPPFTVQDDVEVQVLMFPLPAFLPMMPPTAQAEPSLVFPAMLPDDVQPETVLKLFPTMPPPIPSLPHVIMPENVQFLIVLLSPPVVPLTPVMPPAVVVPVQIIVISVVQFSIVPRFSPAIAPAYKGPELSDGDSVMLPFTVRFLMTAFPVIALNSPALFDAFVSLM